MLPSLHRLKYILKSVAQVYFPPSFSYKEDSVNRINIEKKRKKRVLIIVHGNFFNDKGGVELYVKSLYSRLKNNNDFEFYYLIRINKKELKHGEILTDREDKKVFYINLPDGNVYSLVDRRIDIIFKKLILKINPDTVHFQHFIHFSLTWFEVIKKNLPNTKIILTIHEFLAICANSGQMIKTKWQGNKLCQRSCIDCCKRCFPYLPRKIFEQRSANVKKYFKYIDLMTTPSLFLLNRLVESGIDKSKIIYSENGQDLFEPLSKTKSEILRLLYIGQINRFKGIQVLLSAMEALQHKKIRLSVYGKFQNDNRFNKSVGEKMENLSNVKYYGAYNRDELPKIFSENDVTVVPSVWWENSPLVIQESFIGKTPVICSNIGGMKEKVGDGINGIHFKAGDKDDLIKKIIWLDKNRNVLSKMSKSVPRIKTIDENIKELLSIYR